MEFGIFSNERLNFTKNLQIILNLWRVGVKIRNVEM